MLTSRHGSYLAFVLIDEVKSYSLSDNHVNISTEDDGYNMFKEYGKKMAKYKNAFATFVRSRAQSASRRSPAVFAVSTQASAVRWANRTAHVWHQAKTA